MPGKHQQRLLLPVHTLTASTNPNLILPHKKIPAPQRTPVLCQPQLQPVHRHGLSRHRGMVQGQREAAK